MSNPIQHKMYELEVSPPPGVWNKIAAELDETILPADTASQLYSIEMAPPANAWLHISTTLDAEKEAALPEIRKRSPLLRYAAAAAILVLLAWGALQFFNASKTPSETARIDTAHTQNQTTPNQSNAPSQNTDQIASGSTIPPATSQDAIDDAALEASKKVYAKVDLPNTSRLKSAAGFYFSAPESNVGTRGFSIGNIIPEETNLADRYIMLMTPDGNIIRVSKKLSDLVCCVSGEEQDENCTDQVKKWKEKMANAAIGHSSSNILDILNLVNALQNDNQD